MGTVIDIKKSSVIDGVLHIFEDDGEGIWRETEDSVTDRIAGIFSLDPEKIVLLEGSSESFDFADGEKGSHLIRVAFSYTGGRGTRYFSTDFKSLDVLDPEVWGWEGIRVAGVLQQYDLDDNRCSLWTAGFAIPDDRAAAMSVAELTAIRDAGVFDGFDDAHPLASFVKRAFYEGFAGDKYWAYGDPCELSADPEDIDRYLAIAGNR